ncbi:MAG TPA: hypothetical protein VNM91_02210 [Dehalococcoidia bacterium]|nr:hypothetical protein [Dehalococcoidia bacterium]
MSRLRTGAVALLACLAVTLVACGDANDDAQPSGEPRPFMMGISTLPRELNAQAYGESFELAGDNGDLVLIQRNPPWEDFLPGGDISDDVAETTAAEVAALDEHDLDLFFAIDPTDGATGRDRLVGLPGSIASANFGDPSIQSALLAYAEYVALNYKPAYLAFGVEMNLYFNKNENDVENFRALYLAAYDRVKAASPSTQVTVTFQYEDLQALLPTEEKHFPAWSSLQSFEDAVDIVAISTYPSFAFTSAAAIPENYYSQLTAYTDKPIVIAEMGYASAPGVQGLNSGTEDDQASFVRRVLREADEMEMPFVIWFAAWDPTYAKDSPYVAFQHIGLRRGDDTEKPAWSAWAEAARRPYEPRAVTSSSTRSP